MDVNQQRISGVFKTLHWSWIFRQEEECPTDLLELFTQELDHIDLNSWPERFAWGGVFVNGRPMQENTKLFTPCRVEYFEPKHGLAWVKNSYPKFSNDYIVYEDEDLIASFKPAGLPCMPAREQQVISLKSYLEEYTGSTVHLPSRLDYATAGLLVISRSNRMHALLQQAFEKKLVSKYYLCQIRGKANWDTKLVQAPIAKDTRHPVLRRTVESGGKSAETFFTRICSTRNEKKEPIALLLAQPLTGRTHQIRVHAAHLGFPLIGDNFYGGPRADNLHLLSCRVKLEHPVSGNPLDIFLPKRLTPEWAYFLESGD